MIYTFYSYKGGVGRSMALANIGQYLYSRGARVVMIDWDLEAPGLETFFSTSEDQLLDVRSQLGLIDMLEAYKQQFTHAYSALGVERTAVFEQIKPQLLPVRSMLYPIHAPDPAAERTAPGLWLLPAGWRVTKGAAASGKNDDRFSKYAATVQGFDWTDFYNSYEGNSYFEWFHQQLLPAAPEEPAGGRLGVDAVLVDSRTGVTEMGGICTRQLADVVVCFCAPNYQNLEGVANMAQTFARQEIVQARGRGLEVLVVPARVDEQGATDEEADFRRRFGARAVAPPTFQRNGLDAYNLLLPYIAKYAYAETLAIGVETNKLERAYLNLAHHLVLFTEPESRLRAMFSPELQQISRATRPRVFLWPTDAGPDGVAPGLGNRLAAIGLTSVLDEAQSLLVWITMETLKRRDLRKQVRLARQKGIRVYCVSSSDPHAVDAAWPRVLRTSQIYILPAGLLQLMEELARPGQGVRVPVMAPQVTEFVDRPAERSQLKSALVNSSGEPITADVVLAGPAGSGKTRLAMKLCDDEDVLDAFSDGILWVALGQAPDISAALRSMQVALTGAEPQYANAQSALAAQLSGKSCLVVFDDVWSADHLANFTIPNTCARLVIARNPALFPDFQTITIHAVQSSEARGMLRLGLDIRATHPSLDGLARRLARWPLALSLARAQIAQAVARGRDPVAAVESLSETLDRKGLEALGELAEPIINAVRATLEAQKLLDPSQRELYHSLAIFAPDVDIPVSAIEVVWRLDANETRNCLLTLDKIALLQVNLRSDTVRLNALVREQLAKELQEQAPLHERLLAAWTDPHNLPNKFAWQWLTYHMLHAGRAKEARSLLLDFNWIIAKVTATDLDALRADYTQFADDALISVVRQALGSGGVSTAARLENGLGQATDPESVRLFHAARQWRIVHFQRDFKAHSGCIRALVVNAERLVSGGDDEKIRVWERPSGRLIRELSGHNRPVNALLLLDGGRLLSASNDCTVKLWNMESGALLRTFNGHTNWVLAIAARPAGTVLSGGADGMLLEWDLDTGAQVRGIAAHSPWLTAIGSAEDRIVTCGGDCLLRTWQPGTETELAAFRGHSDWVGALAVDSDGSYAVSASHDCTLRLWRFQGSLEDSVFKGHTGPVYSVTLIPALNRAFSVAADKTLRVWDLFGAREIGSITGSRECITCATAPGGRIVFCGDDAGTIYQFRTEG
jgi:hypothetical protein